MRQETDNGDVFTVYDWKEYTVLDEHEIIEFHIGGMNKAVTEQAKNEIYEALEDKSKRIKQPSYSNTIQLYVYTNQINRYDTIRRK